MFQIIDGSSIAQKIQIQLKEDISKIPPQKRKPNLCVILVGEDPASKIYVAQKEKACRNVGIDTTTLLQKASMTEEELCSLIKHLNEDPKVDGILVQLPLPPQISTFKVLSTIRPHKDVDGLSPYNQGLLAMNKAAQVPCTPSGVIKLLEAINFKFEGALAAVVGRSLLVGSPVSKLLTHKNCTVINIHSRTLRAWELCKQADLLVVAIGSPKLINTKWVKDGAVVIDVGIHRIDGKLCGDVDFEEVKEQTSWITPVPKGVGPMTIACLLLNCFKAYQENSIV